MSPVYDPIVLKFGLGHFIFQNIFQNLFYIAFPIIVAFISKMAYFKNQLILKNGLFQKWAYFTNRSILKIGLFKKIDLFRKWVFIKNWLISKIGLFQKLTYFKNRPISKIGLFQKLAYFKNKLFFSKISLFQKFRRSHNYTTFGNALYHLRNFQCIEVCPGRINRNGPKILFEIFNVRSSLT